jgi:hypothetical protein
MKLRLGLGCAPHCILDAFIAIHRSDLAYTTQGAGPTVAPESNVGEMRVLTPGQSNKRLPAWSSRSPQQRSTNPARLSGGSVKTMSELPASVQKRASGDTKPVFPRPSVAVQPGQDGTPLNSQPPSPIILPSHMQESRMPSAIGEHEPHHPELTHDQDN